VEEEVSSIFHEPDDDGYFRARLSLRRKNYAQREKRRDRRGAFRPSPYLIFWAPEPGIAFWLSGDQLLPRTQALSGLFIIASSYGALYLAPWLWGLYLAVNLRAQTMSPCIYLVDRRTFQRAAERTTA